MIFKQTQVHPQRRVIKFMGKSCIIKVTAVGTRVTVSDITLYNFKALHTHTDTHTHTHTHTIARVI